MNIIQTIEKALFGNVAEEVVAMKIALMKQLVKKHATDALVEALTVLSAVEDKLPPEGE